MLALAATLGAPPAAAGTSSQRVGEPSLGGAEASPSSGLSTGSVVMVSVTGFPGEVVVGAVQCDERVLTRGATYCDTTYLAVGRTDAQGNGAFPFVVRTGAAFRAPAEDAACDAVHPCQVAVQYEDDAGNTTVALATVEFGTSTRTKVAARDHVRPGSRVRLDVRVTPVGAGPLAVLAPPSGLVIVQHGGKTVARRSLSGDGHLVVTRRLTAGRNFFRLVYRGSGEYGRSQARLVVPAR